MIFRRAWLAFFFASALSCSHAPWERQVSSSGVTVPAVKADLEVAVLGTGALEAVSAQPVAVPRMPTGALKVKQVVPEGSLVEAGDVLLVFDDTKLEIDLQNNTATLRSAGRRIERTQLQSSIEAGSIEVMREVAELTRAHASAFDLQDASIYSKLEVLEQAVKVREADETILFADASLLLRGQYYDIDEKILDVERKHVKGKIERVQTALAGLVLKAPIAGMVVYRKNWRGVSVAVGDTIMPGNVVMSIVDPSLTQLEAYVLERDASGVVAGAAAVVRVDARPERAFEGRVKSVAEISAPIERGSPVKYFETTIELLDGDPALLKPGMKATARIVTGKVEDAVVIPRTALRGSSGERHVLVERDGRREKVPVEVGGGDAVRVSVAKGLSAGELVVIGGEVESQPGPEKAPPARASAVRVWGATGS